MILKYFCLGFQCTGGLPCSECAAHEDECLYNQYADKRRKEYTQAIENQLGDARFQVHFYHALLEDLLESIRSSDRTQMRQLAIEICQTEKNANTANHTNYDILRDMIDNILSANEPARESHVLLVSDGEFAKQTNTQCHCSVS